MSERNLKSSRYRVAGLFAAVFLATLWLGCTTKEELVPHDDGLDDILGSNPNRTLAYLNQLNAHWRKSTPDSAILDCTDSASSTGHRPVHVLLYTHALSYKIDAVQVLKREANNNNRGHITMKVVNKDAFECSDLKLQSRDSVYVWAGKTNKDRAFAIFRIDQQGNATGLARAFLGIRCQRPGGVTESKAHAVLAGSCEQDSTGKDILYNDPMPPRQNGFAGPLHDQGLWYACPGGCCQATNFGPY